MFLTFDIISLSGSGSSTLLLLLAYASTSWLKIDKMSGFIYVGYMSFRFLDAIPNTRCITPKSVTSLRGNRAPFEEISLWWQAVGNTVFDLTGQNCGLGGKNKTQEFPKTFCWGISFSIF